MFTSVMDVTLLIFWKYFDPIKENVVHKDPRRSRQKFATARV